MKAEENNEMRKRCHPPNIRGRKVSVLSENESGKTQKITFFGRFNMWRLRFSVNGETVLKIVVISAMTVFFVLLQTTMLTRFRPFGIVPDLLLPFTIAIGVLEREKAGAITGLVSAFIIEAVGGTTITLLPLLYMPAGYMCGLLTTYRFRNSFFVMLTYTAISSFLRSIITVIVALHTVSGITAADAVLDIALSELLVNILFAALPHILVRLIMRPFHKSRAERTGSE